MTITRQARGWDEIRARLNAQVQRPALPLDGLPLAYWREEERLGCAVSLSRLRRLCDERGCDYDKTLKGLSE